MTVARIFRPLLRRTSHLNHGAVRIIVAALAYLLLISPVAAQQAAAQQARPTEYQLKAQYLSDFGRFVKKWSTRAQPSSEETFDVCVLGQDPFGPALDAAVRGEDINGAPVAAKRIPRAQDATGCRVLFISSSEGSQLDAIVTGLWTSPVLTVSDIPGFLKHGGIVEFVTEGNKVKFEINLGAAQRAGLSLSSDLLKVARLVRRTP